MHDDLDRKLHELNSRLRALEQSDAQKTSQCKRLDRQISELSERTAPKPVAVGKVIGIVGTVAVTLFGAVWTLSSEFSERPTLNRVVEIIDRHEARGHERTLDRIGDLQQEVAQLRVVFGDGTLKVFEKKLDQLLELNSGRRRNR